MRKGKTNALAAARELRHLSRETLAERVGVSESFIGLMETGKRFPSFPTMMKLADELWLHIGDVATILHPKYR